jgi:hypothetical protein
MSETLKAAVTVAGNSNPCGASGRVGLQLLKG